jgi:hypothetical protein
MLVPERHNMIGACGVHFHCPWFFSQLVGILILYLGLGQQCMLLKPVRMSKKTSHEVTYRHSL